MSAFVDSLNLRPQEKRIIVGLGVVVFVVLNLVLVFPRFHDWTNINKELDKTRLDITNYSAEIAKDNNPVNGLTNQLYKLEKQQNGAVAFKEIALQQTVTAEARACGIIPRSTAPATIVKIGAPTSADKFFVSESIRIAVQAPEESLVKFLYDVGNDPAMVRVWELTLSPADANRYQLNANITLTADYQKTAETNAAPKAPSVNLPGRVAAPVPAAKTSQPPAGQRAPATKTNQPPPRRGAIPPVMPPIPGSSRRSPKLD